MFFRRQRKLQELPPHIPPNLPEISEDLKILYDGVITSQMIAMSAQFVVRELMIDVAKLHPDPEGYINALYDRSIFHVDRRASLNEEEEKRAVSQTRDALGALFRDALKALRTPPHQDNPQT
jgi:hypothetical protein